ncbi:MAG: class IV adenylate cyclase [Pirellulaceae bacterium]|nr:class IV adenylate cyclase [Pirellulaceae bacterium]
MAQNVEIKAQLIDFNRQFELAKNLTATPGERIEQTDVFFRCQSGRLKLRIFDDDNGELISYERPDQIGPKTSSYYISRTGEPNALCDVLTRSLGVTIIVKKTRVLFLSGRTRIHLDQVEGLGAFLELEVVLDAGDCIEKAQQEAKELMAKLEIDPDWLIDRAYADLLSEAAASNSCCQESNF